MISRRGFLAGTAGLAAVSAAFRPLLALSPPLWSRCTRARPASAALTGSSTSSRAGLAPRPTTSTRSTQSRTRTACPSHSVLPYGVGRGLRDRGSRSGGGHAAAARGAAQDRRPRGTWHAGKRAGMYRRATRRRRTRCWRSRNPEPASYTPSTKSLARVSHRAARAIRLRCLGQPGDARVSASAAQSAPKAVRLSAHIAATGTAVARTHPRTTIAGSGLAGCRTG
jgi:hypothetical protein